MTLEPGDKIKTDGTEYRVTKYDSWGNGYWVTDPKHTQVWFPQEAINKGLENATIHVVFLVPRGKTVCSYHNWIRYVGAREVYDFCRICDEKRFIDWEDLR